MTSTKFDSHIEMAAQIVSLANRFKGKARRLDRYIHNSEPFLAGAYALLLHSIEEDCAELENTASTVRELLATEATRAAKAGNFELSQNQKIIISEFMNLIENPIQAKRPAPQTQRPVLGTLDC